jgi:hypothetical protein
MYGAGAGRSACRDTATSESEYMKPVQGAAPVPGLRSKQKKGI